MTDTSIPPLPILPPAKRLGGAMSAAMVVGTMIGSGIYLLPTTLAPFGPNLVVAFAITIAGTMCLAIAFAKLAARLPGGPFVYVRSAFGDTAAFVTMWSYIISQWTGVAAVAVAVAGAIGFVIPAAGSGVGLTIVALGTIAILTLVNLTGARSAGWVQLGATLIKIIPLFAVVLLVAVRFGTRPAGRAARARPDHHRRDRRRRRADAVLADRVRIRHRRRQRHRKFDRHRPARDDLRHRLHRADLPRRDRRRLAPAAQRDRRQQQRALRRRHRPDPRAMARARSSRSSPRSAPSGRATPCSCSAPKSAARSPSRATCRPCSAAPMPPAPRPGRSSSAPAVATLLVLRQLDRKLRHGLRLHRARLDRRQPRALRGVRRRRAQAEGDGRRRRSSRCSPCSTRSRCSSAPVSKRPCGASASRSSACRSAPCRAASVRAATSPEAAPAPAAPRE